MTGKNSKRSALVASVLAIALCAAIIAGATFALYPSGFESSLTVTAVSVFDPEKSASAVVAVVPGSPADAGGGLPVGAVAAIAAGCAILAAAAAVIVWRIVKNKKTHN